MFRLDFQVPAKKNMLSNWDGVWIPNPCSFPQKRAKDTVKNYEYQTVPFEGIKQYPLIPDTLNFIQALQKNCHLYERRSEVSKINFFKKTQIYGSEKDYIVLEYDYNDGNGAMGACPWKNQIIFDSQGKLIRILSCDRVDFVTLFSGKNPFLMGVSSDAKGNGKHSIYKIQQDTFENIFNGFSANRPQTYDGHQDRSVNEPTEFPYSFQDKNQDGYKDLIFQGNIVVLEEERGVTQGRNAQGEKIEYTVETPYKKVPVFFIFLYNPQTGHFEEEENYSKKYEFIFGNSREKK
jgi:hypothetical protein